MGKGEPIIGGTAGDNMLLVDAVPGELGGGDADATLQRIGLQADLTLTKTVDKPVPQVASCRASP